MPIASPFAGIDPALAAAVAADWRRTAASWHAAALSAATLAARTQLDPAAGVLAGRLGDDLEAAAALLAERARAADAADELTDWLSGGARGHLVAELAEPTPSAWADLVAAGTLSDGARTVRYFELPADTDGGVVVADFFIPERASLFLAGDGRDHADPVFGPLSDGDSRVVLVLDRTSGRGSIQFDDTCTAWAGWFEVCNEARPIELAGDRGSPPWRITNQVDITADEERITVGYDVLNGITPLGSTDGTFTLTDRGDGAFELTAIDADEYPAIGIYQYREAGEAPRVVMQRDSEGVGHLFPWWPRLPSWPGRRVRGTFRPRLEVPSVGKPPAEN